MSTNPFAAPAPASGGINWADHLGRLLIVEPIAAETGIKTSYGDADAIRANVHVIDGPTPASFDDTLVFPKVLASQLRPKIGEKVLGRLGQGQAKPGQSAPWTLLEASAEDVTAGMTWLESRKSGAFATPGPTTGATPPF